MAAEKAGAKMVRLKVTANLLEAKGAEQVPKAVAYAFTSGGKLLAREPVDQRGHAVLSFPATTAARSIRVVIGPEAEQEKILAADLKRRGAEERFVRVDPENLAPSFQISIIPDRWRCWLLGLCFVSGNLLKREVRNGIPVDLPVCNATVEVYEVDPIYIIIPRLPDYAIEKLRQHFINPQPLPPAQVELNPQPLPPGLEAALNPQPLPPAREATANAAVQATMSDNAGATDELRFLAKTTNTEQFRQVLIKNVDLVRPLICLFFPMFVTTRLLTTTTTDECGRFQTLFFKGCNNPDIPDLYFKAKQRLFGFFWVYIYAPTPIACYTFWNYQCGTDVTLYTTSPFAITCPPCPSVNAPDDWVLVMAIGNLPLSRIYGSSVPLQATTNSTNMGLTDGGAPFGGLLRLRMEFDNSLRDTLNVKYYRVYFRKGASGSFTPLTGSVVRHYTLEVAGDLVLKVYPLGPFVVGSQANLFEIPPALPPEGQWSFPDLLEDLTNAKFPTNDLAPAADAGLYQLKVDLFDSAGNLVDIATTGINYRVPAVTDLSGDVDTDDASTLGLVFDDDGDGKASFIMTLHVDNNVCSASIAAPTLDGTPADDNCGVLNYDPSSPGSVTMTYTASHPNGFATYSFTLYRGVNPLTPPSTSGPVNGGSFSTTQTTSYLLGGCTVAGYSENVYVAASATDGWYRLSNYDAQAVRAFVLAPEE